METRPTLGNVTLSGEQFDTLRVKLMMLSQRFPEGHSTRRDIEDCLNLLTRSINP